VKLSSFEPERATQLHASTNHLIGFSNNNKTRRDFNNKKEKRKKDEGVGSLGGEKRENA